MSIVHAVLLAVLTGAHAATWGAFKDSPFEGFRIVSFVRSIVVAVVAAGALVATTRLETTLAPVVWVGVLYAVERLATEWWKSFIREDDQGAFAIPMRIAVHGRPVDARLPRYAAGCLVVGGMVLLGGATTRLQEAVGGPLWLLVLVGGIGGWLTAAGGAWKDAPVEGFSGWKFLRSPVVATAWTLVLLPFTHDWVVLTVAAAGLSVLSIETYKTFLTGGRPPGKFAGKPERPGTGTQRDRCRLLHSGIYAGMACVIGLAALFEALDGFAPRLVSLVLLTVFAAGMTVLVTLSPAASEAAGRRLGTVAVPPGRPGRTSDADATLRRTSRAAGMARRLSFDRGLGESLDGSHRWTARHRQERPGQRLRAAAARRPHPERLG